MSKDSRSSKNIARKMRSYNIEGRFKSRKQAIAFALHKARRNGGGGYAPKKRNSPARARNLFAEHLSRPEFPLPHDADFYGV